MKTLLITCVVFICTGFISCDTTQKQSNTTRNPDTIVVKKDSAIKKIDTLGFENK
ncbi:MAG: hypothetical protein IPM96_08510 [Ignavibacteria bacterium]|nr:hypothetical protein [Ignavibacteria bacterium]